MGECTACPAGSTVGADHTTCTLDSCPAGYEPTTIPGFGGDVNRYGLTTECTACPRGQVSEDGTSCHACADGLEYAEAGDGSTSCVVCAGDCAPVCDDGYELNSANSACVEINECLLDPNPCQIQDSCVNTVGSYTCSCPANSAMDADGN